MQGSSSDQQSGTDRKSAGIRILARWSLSKLMARLSLRKKPLIREQIQLHNVPAEAAHEASADPVSECKEPESEWIRINKQNSRELVTKISSRDPVAATAPIPIPGVAATAPIPIPGRGGPAVRMRVRGRPPAAHEETVLAQIRFQRFLLLGAAGAGKRSKRRKRWNTV